MLFLSGYHIDVIYCVRHEICWRHIQNATDPMFDGNSHVFVMFYVWHLLCLNCVLYISSYTIFPFCFCMLQVQIKF